MRSADPDWVNTNLPAVLQLVTEHSARLEHWATCLWEAITLVISRRLTSNAPGASSMRLSLTRSTTGERQQTSSTILITRLLPMIRSTSTCFSRGTDSKYPTRSISRHSDRISDNWFALSISLQAICTLSTLQRC